MTKTRDIEAGPSGDAGRNLIAVIGIDRYRHWRRLSNAVADARGARGLFHQLGFRDAVDPLLDEQATRDAMHALVSDELLVALRPEDSLVLFYAGHGGTRWRDVGGKQIRTGYLIPIDAQESPHRAASWIDLDAWLRQVALLPAKHILVILDACHSGIALNRIHEWRGGESTRHDPLAALRTRRSRRVITSALDDQRALDSGPVAGHSLFTGYLIEGLTGGISGVDGVTTGSSLGEWVRERVQRYPGAHQTPGSGTFDHHDHGEMVLPVARRRRPSPPPIPRPASSLAASPDSSAIAEPRPPTRPPPPPPPPRSPVLVLLPEAQEPVAGELLQRRNRRLAFAMGASVLAVVSSAVALAAGGVFEPTPLGPTARDRSDHPGPRHVDAPDVPLDAWIERTNPFVSVGELAIQAHQVTRAEYARYLVTLSGEVRTASTPRFDWDGRRMAEPLTSVTFHQAAAFCAAIEARLPTAAEWERAAGGRWGIDPTGSGPRGPNREWTRSLSRNKQTVRVCGATRALARRLTAPELELELVTAYYKSLETSLEPAQTSRERDPVSDPEVGFRCVR